MHSLRLRLLLSLIAVMLAMVAVLALVASLSTTTFFRRYVAGELVRDKRMMDVLLTAEYGPTERIDLQKLAGQLAQTSGDQTVIADRHGAVIADSAGALVGQRVDVATTLPTIKMRTEPLSWNTTASLTTGIAKPAVIAVAPGLVARPNANYMILRMGQPARSIGAIGFINAVHQSLFLAAVVAGSVAVLLMVGLSRRIMAPIESLTAAAHAMARGDLGQRVVVERNDELGTLAQAFNGMADGLMNLEQLRRNMVSDVAHELRTPLTNIRGYLEALRDGVAEPTPATIASLHEEALLLNRLVDDLQELALAESGRLRLRLEPAQLATIVEQAVTVAQPSLAAKGLRVEVALAPDLPLVHVDTNRVGQIVRNLLANAVTHSHHDGQIIIAAQVDGMQLRVSIADTGCGIPARHLPHVFDRFYRADPSRTRATGGSGLGLAIVKELVEAHGGTISVHSVEGAGTTFDFTLPIEGSGDRGRGLVR